MNIGTIIRTYRKEKNMTQEEMANRLGVTAPAVNKWENGNSYPDISLLAPIARLLGISTDTLLSYEETLSNQEINQIALEVNEKMQKDNYDTAFSFAMEKIQKYPNCENLIFNLAPLLECYLTLLSEKESAKYEKQIYALYQQLLESDNSQIANQALLSLFSHSLKKEDYNNAQEYLDRLPRLEHNPDQYQAVLYDKQGKNLEAYQLYEKLLFSGYSNLSWALLGLYRMAMKENDFDRAYWLLGKHKELAHLLEMGLYQEFSPEWDFMVARKDVDGALRILEILAENVNSLDAFKNSDLYCHMKFSEHGTENLTFMLKKCFEEEAPEFLKGNERYQELIKKLENS
ncbi:helix-turn-helix domain-containing protein [Roseburia sp. 499]|uniref:helix-turn-helix domain-containing protein n=1 Tax=Roseburia sp. 499 TaxID=1261634 RepID=UPI000951407D|nr:helix-turn-helix transcriptional regulator [Roseburia sp. 499]WVK69819.1 helix-turn-helix transcriptional regulator [Roseburia sp. 499]